MSLFRRNKNSWCQFQPHSKVNPVQQAFFLQNLNRTEIDARLTRQLEVLQPKLYSKCLWFYCCSSHTGKKNDFLLPFCTFLLSDKSLNSPWTHLLPSQNFSSSSSSSDLLKNFLLHNKISWSIPFLPKSNIFSLYSSCLYSWTHKFFVMYVHQKKKKECRGTWDIVKTKVTNRTTSFKIMVKCLCD